VHVMRLIASTTTAAATGPLHAGAAQLHVYARLVQPHIVEPMQG
jgi:hypothetical protein